MRIFLSALCLTVLLLPNFGGARPAAVSAAPQQPPQHAQDNARAAQRLRARAAFASGRELLTRRGVPFDPDVLLEQDWRAVLKETLRDMPEMQTTRRLGKTLKGAQLAGTLYLPEQVTLTGDTVILARSIVFEGRDVLIKGPHDINIFPVDEVTVPDEPAASAPAPAGAFFLKAGFTPAARARSGRITIDTRGNGRDEWLAGLQAAAPFSTPALCL